MQDEGGELVGAPEARGVRNLRAQRRPGVVREARHHGRLEDAGGDGDYPDEACRELSRGGKGQPDNSRLRRRVRGLADLALEGGDGGGVDDHSPLPLLRLGGLHSRRGEAQDVEGADEVDHDHPLEVLEGQRAGSSQDPARCDDARAVDSRAERAKLLSLGHGGGDLLRIGNVGRNELGPSAELPRCGRAARRGQVDDDDAHPVGAQRAGGREPEAGGAPGDER